MPLRAKKAPVTVTSFPAMFYRLDFWRRGHLTTGIGTAGTLSQVPRQLRDVYGDAPASVLVFVHAALG